MLTLAEAAEMTGLSVPTLKRNFDKFIVHLTPRRYGMKLKHVISIKQPASPK